jgi:EpsG-like putative glucosyltransferase
VSEYRGLFPYWILFSMFAAGAFQARNDPRPSETSPLLIGAITLTALMIGLRFETGGDWANYDLIFEFLAYENLGSALINGDPGYNLLNWLAHRLGVGIWFVNLVCAAIFSWGLLKFAKGQPNPWLACLVAVPYLIIVVAMGYTRQAVAIGLIMAGFTAFAKGSIVRFAVYIVLAVAFHKTALIMIPFVGIATTRHRPVVILFTIFLAGLLYYFFVASSVDRMTTNYTTGLLESEGAAIRVAMNVVPAVIFLLAQRRFGFSDHERKLWRNLSLTALAALAALLAFPDLSTLVDRLSLYLLPLQLVILSRLPNAFSDKRTRGMEFVLLIGLYAATIQFTWLNYATHARLWLPYKVYPMGYDAAELY